MTATHYKLPLDDMVDKDIIDWINKFPRTKKGEMVRHAIRYYMSVAGNSEQIQFPASAGTIPNVVVQSQPSEHIEEASKSERKKPKLNRDALKGKVD